MWPFAVCLHQDGEWKSKGCGMVKFEWPEVAQRACCMMSGMKLIGQETDVQINRHAEAVAFVKHLNQTTEFVVLLVNHFNMLAGCMKMSKNSLAFWNTLNLNYF